MIIYMNSLLENINNFSLNSNSFIDLMMKIKYQMKVYNNLLESFINTNYKFINNIFEKEIYNVKQLINITN